MSWVTGIHPRQYLGYGGGECDGVGGDGCGGSIGVVVVVVVVVEGIQEA